MWMPLPIRRPAFQSTPPARGATCSLRSASPPVLPISIHAPREGGDQGARRLRHRGDISIHAPREGGDAGEIKNTEERYHISIHAPREGGDFTAGYIAVE